MNTVIIINSCDDYSDLWDLFFLCMSDYWNDCAFSIVLNTESKNHVLQKNMSFNIAVHHYTHGKKDLWGKRLISTLKDIEAEFVIMLYDDFFLNASVSQDRLNDFLSLLLKSPEIGVIYLTKLLGVEKKSSFKEGLSILAPKADYRLNSSPAIWRKDVLLKFTAEKDNPWAWEYFGSFRTFEDPLIFLAISDSATDVYPYDYRKGGAIYRGKWVSEVINPIIKRHKLTLNLDERGVIEKDYFPKRSISWKISFMLTGVQMIGTRIFVVIYRIFRLKITNILQRF